MQSTQPKKEKFTFILPEINPSEVDKKFNIKFETNLDIEPSSSVNTTKIIDLQMDESMKLHSFIHESKKYTITMIDSVSKTRINCNICFWDHQPFDTQPIGCPIDFEAHILEKTVTYKEDALSTMTQHVSKQKIKQVNTSTNGIVVTEKNVYVTDGIFCSFNCCLAFIMDNAHTMKYVKSRVLLMKMYTDIFQQIKLIKPAPSWRLLEQYGGSMTIDQFKNSFNNYVYITQGEIRNLQKTKPKP